MGIVTICTRIVVAYVMVMLLADKCLNITVAFYTEIPGLPFYCEGGRIRAGGMAGGALAGLKRRMLVGPHQFRH